MKSWILRSLLALAASGAVVAGCADVPTAPEQANSEIATGSPKRLLNSQMVTPLDAEVSCEPVYHFWAYWFSCTAFAFGGSGTGYSMTWDNAMETTDGGGYSHAWASCDFDGNYYYPTDVYVTIRDSDGSTLTVLYAIPCSDW